MIATKNEGFSKAADGIAKIRTEFHGFMVRTFRFSIGETGGFYVALF